MKFGIEQQTQCVERNAAGSINQQLLKVFFVIFFTRTALSGQKSIKSGKTVEMCVLTGWKDYKPIFN